MITEAEQQGLDIDWFFTDGDNIGFVASGGGKLPLSISNSSRSDIEEVAHYFRSLPIIGDAIVNPNLNEAMGDRVVNDRYLADFVAMAKRGLYAFDKNILNSFTDTNYYLVATPTYPIQLQELPPVITNRVIQTRVNDGIKEYLNIESL